MMYDIGSILSSIAVLMCGGAAVLVALAFILYRAVTSSREARNSEYIWGPHEPRPFGGIPSTGSQYQDPEDRR